jgi:hypothetical protein
MKTWQWAPWFHTDASDEQEPFSYRGWKYVWQHLPINTDSDLFERIETVTWDLLIVLDACRYDVLAELCDIGVVERTTSPASSTPEFLRAADAVDLFSDTTYVSANPQVDKHSPGDCTLLRLFADHWDPDLSTVIPGTVYSEAIPRVRDGERVVAHTLQPHYPHVCEVDDTVRPVVNGLHPNEIPSLSEESVVQAALATGLVDLDTAWRSYRLATAFAWRRARSVALTLAEEGYTTAITADHGELFGEWGFVEHPVGVRVQEVITVPWLVVRPHEGEESDDRATETVEHRLRALGYAE